MPRMRAKSTNPTVKKMDKLFEYMRKVLKLEVGIQSPGKFVIRDMEQDLIYEWEVCKVLNGVIRDRDYIQTLPPDDYKLCADYTTDPIRLIHGMVPRVIPTYPQKTGEIDVH